MFTTYFTTALSIYLVEHNAGFVPTIVKSADVSSIRLSSVYVGLLSSQIRSPFFKGYIPLSVSKIASKSAVSKPYSLVCASPPLKAMFALKSTGSEKPVFSSRTLGILFPSSSR